VVDLAAILHSPAGGDELGIELDTGAGLGGRHTALWANDAALRLPRLGGSSAARWRCINAIRHVAHTSLPTGWALRGSGKYSRGLTGHTSYGMSVSNTACILQQIVL